MKPVDQNPANLVFPKAYKSIREGKCPICGSTDKYFRNRDSLREHSISGICQKCQDAIFGED